MAADQKIETRAWVIKPAFDRPGDARPIKSRFHHPVSYSVPCYLVTHRLSGFTKTHQSVYVTQWPKPVSIQFNCKNSIQNAPKLAFFELKNRNIFWGWGTAPSQDPSASGEGDIPTPYRPTPQSLRLRRSTPGVAIRPPPTTPSGSASDHE